jgi:glycosyltransferase involved in cell wall biosynthesis
MFAGNVCLQKGVLDLMVAFRLLEPGSARLVLAGAIDPAIAPLLKDLPPGMELAGKLNRDALQRLMSESWAIVQPSIQDGFGMVAAEAMACGTPAIISQNAGACELICEGRNGWVVPARSPEALAEAMEACLSQPERTHAMGAEALRMMKALGGWDAYGDRIAEILFGLARPPAEAQTSR